MTNLEIGSRIEARRKELGYTLEDISYGIGVSRSTIQRYEKGLIDKIKLPVLESIARFLRVNPAWLIGKSEQMFETTEEYAQDRVSFTTNDLRFALWGGDEGMDDDDLKAVLDYAEYIRQKKQKDRA